MSRVSAGITISVDGYFAGPDDHAGQGLGVGGERLHYWVFGGPWTYDTEQGGDPVPEDKEWLEEQVASTGAVVGGRWTYEASGHWGGTNPWGLPFVIVTHRPEEQPEGAGFTFINGVTEAVEQAKNLAGGKGVHIMGGGDVIRQALDAGVVEQLSMIIAPVILGGGKRLFDGLRRSFDLQQLGVRQSRFATFVDYGVNVS
ncbi:MAG: dihydrofolate reductase family protein [Candidatus Dormibacteraeota bacterium]|nr:dihydrofolate reductase family protein [Candidatus Dormibacteraeota bacterium]MBV9525200.1 dihydrofolate reductase family protein [Candidatus Dormibacteraeota bacterium]